MDPHCKSGKTFCNHLFSSFEEAIFSLKCFFTDFNVKFEKRSKKNDLQYIANWNRHQIIFELWMDTFCDERVKTFVPLPWKCQLTAWMIDEMVYAPQNESLKSSLAKYSLIYSTMFHGWNRILLWNCRKQIVFFFEQTRKERQQLEETIPTTAAVSSFGVHYMLNEFVMKDILTCI